MNQKHASITRTYYTTLSFEQIHGALEQEEMKFMEGVKGRIFFRLPDFPDTCVELCRGGALMLKGAFDLEAIQDDYIIAKLFDLQCKHFASTTSASYKLTSVHPSRRWLRETLAECIKTLIEENLPDHKDNATQTIKKLTSNLSREKLREKSLTDEITHFKIKRLQRFLSLLLTSQKDAKFTPLVFEDVFWGDEKKKNCLAIIDPQAQHSFNPQAASNTMYFFNPQMPSEFWLQSTQ
jgi:hypothetical protein